MKRRAPAVLLIALVALITLFAWLLWPRPDPAPRAAATREIVATPTIDPPQVMASTFAPAAPREATSRLIIDDATTDEDRVVRGFVLDLSGHPVAGARVRLSDMLVDLDWITTSDSGGAFAFVGAPSSPLKVEASMSASRDMVWVTSGTDEAEVELVLEPTAIIRVIGRPGQAGTAEVRCPSDACFGGGAPWQRPLITEPVAIQRVVNPDRVVLTEVFADVPDEPMRYVPIQVPGAGPVEIDLSPAEYVPPANPDPAADFMPYGDTSRWTLVAAGALREDLEVTADLSYDVFIVDGAQRIPCGSVRPAPGEVVEVPCGPGTVELTGRAISEDGSPRVGLAMVLKVYDNSQSGLPDDLTITVVSGAEGRFEIEADVPGALHGFISAEYMLGDLGAIPLVPGTRHDLGDVMFRNADHGPALTRAKLLDPWGPVGAVFGKSSDGVRVLIVEPGGPFELAGIESQDVLIRIEGRSTVDVDDIERMLAGDHGSTVNLRVRSADGTLADVVVTRDATPPDPSTIVEVERAVIDDE